MDIQAAAKSSVGSASKSGARVALYIDPGRIYRWHKWLADQLRSLGFEVIFCQMQAVQSARFSCDMMLDLERMIYRLGGEQAIDLLSVDEVKAVSSSENKSDPFDVAINFTEHDIAVIAHRHLTPLFDGLPGDIGAYRALLEKRNVEILIEDSAQPRGGAWRARPAVEEKIVVARALNNVFSRAVELLANVVEDRAASSSFAVSVPARREDQARKCPSLAATVGNVGRDLVHKLSARVKKLVTAEERWAIAWRRVQGDGLMTNGAAATAHFNMIPDDGQRYFADPFIFQKDGLTYIFCEEYPFKTLKGIISVFTLDEHGQLSAPRVVLERPYHLSYPLIFERDGEIWMMPETGDSGSVELYRATSFPFIWEKEGALLEGVVGYDATLCQHDDRLWLFFSNRYRQSSSWDNLQIYHADQLLGDWQPHAKNTVLVDGHSSRPGGGMIHHNGAMLRPAQDGSNSYGGGLSICRVDRLDREDFAQSVVGAISVTSPKSARGIHTINQSGNVEVVDIFGAMKPDCAKIGISYKPVGK